MASTGASTRISPECCGDFLDVLGGGGEEALLLDLVSPAQACISVAVKLFRVGEAPLNGLFSPFVDLPSALGEAVLVCALAVIFPEMASA